MHKNQIRPSDLRKLQFGDKITLHSNIDDDYSIYRTLVINYSEKNDTLYFYPEGHDEIDSIKVDIVADNGDFNSFTGDKILGDVDNLEWFEMGWN